MRRFSSLNLFQPVSSSSSKILSNCLALSTACTSTSSFSSYATNSFVTTTTNFVEMTPISTNNNNNMICSMIIPSEVSQFRFHGFGKAERGKVRLSYEERLSKRTPKTREQKKEHEARNLESEQYVDTELPDICEGEKEKVKERAQHMADKLLHPVTAMFNVEVEIGGQHRKMSQIATFVKVNAREYDILPNQSAFMSAILQRLPRYDPTLAPQKQGDKVRVTIIPMTKYRRLACSDHIKELKIKSHKAFSLIRRNAFNHLDEFGIAADLAENRKADAEEMIKRYEHELAEAMEEISQSVLQAQDEDEDGGEVV